MKIGKFNTNKACNVAITHSLLNPFTGEVLKDDDGRTLDVYVYGAHSDASRNAMKERDRKYGDVKAMSEEELTNSGAEYLAAITAGWSDNVEDDNGPVAFSREKAAELYKTEDWDWVAKQVGQASRNMSNYDPKKLKSSAPGSKGSAGSTRPQKSKS